ncbi:FAD-dependent monooxygenase [Nocardiopsis sediminis]|uniref:FAD-dependent monooxygenase n=1 Tax=Nocardiopsis sediminis TaxID=1778267 RepID=A0ABV8FNJ8_9ACTN
MREETTPVLIVGGGLAGLSASLFLSWHGVPSVLAERHTGTSTHPKAWGLYPRTMELLRTVGVESAVLAESAGFSGHVLNGRVESLAGREVSIGRIPAPEDVGHVSPVERVVSLSQDRIEPILLRRARELGADVRFGTELTELGEPGDDGVRAVLTDRATGRRSAVRARYVIAADGAHSRLRERLGIARRGRGTLRHQMSILFRADLRGVLGDRRFAICQVRNAQVEGVLGHDDSLRQGTLIVTYRPEDGQGPEDFTEERCTQLVRAAIGVPGQEVAIRSALPWEMAALVAERFRSGRVFLAGDAAHVLPPVGGYGANTGIQDVHNLAWKLAAVVGGVAGEALLDTYDTERRPVAEATMRQAGLRLAARAGFAGPEQKAALLGTLTVTFGYRYLSPAIAAEAGAEEEPPFTDPVALSAEPGTRAPHLRVERDGRAMSLLDLFGSRPVLLAGGKGGAWCDTARAAARSTGIPLDAYREDADFTATGRAWHTAYGVGPEGAVLVRPDGFVGWRSPGPPEAAAVPLATALELMMGRAGD